MAQDHGASDGLKSARKRQYKLPQIRALFERNASDVRAEQVHRPPDRKSFCVWLCMVVVPDGHFRHQPNAQPQAGVSFDHVGINGFQGHIGATRAAKAWSMRLRLVNDGVEISGSAASCSSVSRGTCASGWWGR